MNEQVLLTTKEVARFLGVNIMTVYRLVDRGELLAYRVGSLRRFGKEDIERYLERSKRQ